jgi:hypothetical protein
MVAAVSMTAQAADETLTLACQSTTTAGTEDKPEPISMGIIVNFTKKTVHGFGDPIFGEQLIKITGMTETAVYFSADDLGAVSPEAQGNMWCPTVDRIRMKASCARFKKCKSSS